jgi:Zn-dependent protease with chaperone function
MMTLFSRYNEFGADRFSAELGYGKLCCLYRLLIYPWKPGFDHLKLF